MRPPAVLSVRIVLAACFLAASVLPGASPVSAGSLDWRTVRSDEGRFSVSMPATPRPVSGHEETAVGSIQESGLEAQVGGLLLKVQHHDIPRLGMLLISREGLLSLVVSRLMDERHARVQRDEAILVHGHTGRALRYARIDQGERLEEAYVVLVGRRLYITTAGPAGDPDARDSIARFFASFDVWEDGEG
jgi:hypothetical protein